jgi:hypothetical protein
MCGILIVNGQVRGYFHYKKKLVVVPDPVMGQQDVHTIYLAYLGQLMAERSYPLDD